VYSTALNNPIEALDQMNATYVNEIEQIVQMIFETMLAMEVHRTNNDEDYESHRLLGTIQITGETPVSVVLSLSDGVVRDAAATMLQLPCEDVSDEDERDVVAELANMIGGNLKSMIQGASHLSLPTVVEGRNLGLQVPGAEMIDDVVFQCDSGTLRVRLFTQLKTKPNKLQSLGCSDSYKLSTNMVSRS
jgi:CheY-specific phosphatase CheX